MPEHCDALVIGAGPAGSATAQRLSAAGHHVILADKSHFPRDKCCSEYASPETLRELDALGVLGTLDANDWTALDGTAVTGAGGSRLHGRFAHAAVTPFRSHGMALPRRELDATLRTSAEQAGASVHEGLRLVALQRRTDGTVQATLDGGTGPTTVTARVVVGADGLGSRVQRLVHARGHGRLRRVAFVAHVRGVRDMARHAELHVGRESYVGLNPLTPDLTNVAVVVRAQDAAAARGDALGFFHRSLATFPDIAARVAVGTLARPVMVTGPFDVRSRRATTDGVALVGDAAEFFDPFTGEGIWTALVGARLLADSLDPLLRESSPITDRALASYRRARRRRFAGKWRVERTIGHAMRWPALFDGAIRRIEQSGLADTVIGITGDFVPASRMLRPDVLWRLIVAGGAPPTAKSSRSSTIHKSAARQAAAAGRTIHDHR